MESLRYASAPARSWYAYLHLHPTIAPVHAIPSRTAQVHHGFDKIQNVDGFSANVVAKFFGFLPGPPQFWTLSAAATQIAGAVLLSLGVFSRPTALAMSATMITAVIFHLLNTGPEAFPLGIPKAHSYNFELAAMYVFVLGYFSVAGAGKYSIDEQVLGGELNFYSGLLDKAFGGEEEE